jgi:hypothetical protein
MPATEALIDKCLDSGWRLSPSIGNTALIPPEGDPRISWCATWEKVKYDGGIVYVPHWAKPGKYEEKDL